MASVSTWISISASVKPAGKTMRLVITAAAGSAMATFFALEPDFLITRSTAWVTSSNFSITPSITQPASSVSRAQRSKMYEPSGLWSSSTSLMLDELMSRPISGAGLRSNRDAKGFKQSSSNKFFAIFIEDFTSIVAARYLFRKGISI